MNSSIEKSTTLTQNQQEILKQLNKTKLIYGINPCVEITDEYVRKFDIKPVENIDKSWTSTTVEDEILPRTQDNINMTGISSTSSPITVIDNNVFEDETVNLGVISSTSIGNLSTHTESIGCEEFLQMKNVIKEVLKTNCMQGLIIGNLQSRLNELSNKIYTPLKEEIMKLKPDAYIPTRGNPDDACKDLFALYTVVKIKHISDGIEKEVNIETDQMIVPAHGNILIKTGIALAWDSPEYYVQILSRSGMAYKNNLVAQAGVIDYSYRQDIGVLLHNNTDKPFVVKKGDRIAQYTYVRIAPYNNTDTRIVEKFSIPKFSDREGGFGSTGV